MTQRDGQNKRQQAPGINSAGEPDARMARRQRQAAHKARVRKRRILVGSALLVVLLAAGGAALILSSAHHTPAPSASRQQTAAREPIKQESAPATYTITLDVSGNAEAQVTPTKITNPVGAAPARLPYAVLNDKRFVGWYTGPSNDTTATCIDNSMLDRISTSANTTLYARFEPAPKGVDRSVAGLPVLMYHEFYDASAGQTAGTDIPQNHMEIGRFSEELAYLKAQHYYFPHWNEVLAFVQGKIRLPAKSIVLTSDDGMPSFYSLALPAVKQHQVYMTGFIIGTNVAKYQINLASYDRASVDFESHTYNLHYRDPQGNGEITIATDAQIIADVVREAQVLGPTKVICYPYGRPGRDYTQRDEQVLASQGYELALTTGVGKVYPGLNPMALPRVRINASDDLATFAQKIK
ncbi:MAG: polysaccharide deacetylase family protein [Coriobacteriia bacterium]|nr:polysaccharide deacetylase family protein [Coriobacteriia bacterium]